jgi:hypothetical protein
MDEEMDSLFDSFHKNSYKKNRLNVDFIYLEGLSQSKMQNLYRFPNQLTEEQINSLTKESFKTLARKQGMVTDLFTKAIE